MTVHRLADRAGTPQPLPASLFKTRFGALPPLLAGRSGDLLAVEEFLSRIEQGCGDEALWGLWAPRGRGKTVLMNIMVHRAKKRGVSVVSLGPSDSPEQVAGILSEGLSGTSVSRSGIQSKDVRGSGGLGIVKGTAGRRASRQAGATWTYGPPTVREALERRLSNGEKVLLVMDEAHRVAQNSAEHVLMAYRDLEVPGACLGLAYAGTPELPDHLRSLGVTFVDRPSGDGQRTLANISDADAFLAVFGPFAHLGILPPDMSSKSAGTLGPKAARSCSGFPYFIQLMGQALHNAAKAQPPKRGRLEERHFEDAWPLFEEKRNRLHEAMAQEFTSCRTMECAVLVADWLRRNERISRNDLLTLTLRGLNSRSKREKAGEALRLKTWLDADIGSQSVLTSFLHQGFIWAGNGLASSEFEAGVPCLVQYILRNAPDYAHSLIAPRTEDSSPDTIPTIEST